MDPMDNSPDFSLALGGPLHWLSARLRPARPPLELTRLRILLVIEIGWLPLVLLSAAGGRLAGAGNGVPFLHDVEAHVRFLIALPILILAERVVDQALRPAVRQLVERGIVLSDEKPKLDAAIAWTMRLRSSVAIEIGLLVFVYTVGHWLWRSQVALDRATWYATPGDSGLRLTAAGYWYAFVSIPIFQFTTLQWFFRLLLWFGLVWRVSKLNLQLTPTHPDRAGGLGFLGKSAYGFGPILFAQGAMLAGVIASRILHEGKSLLAFEVDAAGLILLCVVFTLAPLAVFTPRLVRSKKQGLREYGLLANRYVRQFDDKWIRGRAPSGEALIGSADIQSLADLGNSYALVKAMRPVPFSLEIATRLALITVAPLLPLILTVVPLEQLIEHLIKSLL
ncbi:MAG: hypothetical protein ACRD1P_09385 [Thermoanaerobaculia bacterium]